METSKEIEVENAAVLASAECEVEEIERLGRFVAAPVVDLVYIRSLTSLPGNPFLEAA